LRLPKIATKISGEFNLKGLQDRISHLACLAAEKERMKKQKT